MPARSWRTHGRSIGLGAAAVLAILVLGGGRLGAAPVMGGTLAAGLDSQSVTLDPHASTAAISYLVASLNVTESLVYQQADGKFVPWLAAGYTMSPDGRTFTFSLRKDVSFSDGAPFNAEAVKWNLDRIVNPSFKAGGSANALVGYAGTTVVDSNTVRVTFKEPYAPFLAYVAQGVLAMLSPKTTPTQGNEVNLRPVGSGAFTVAEYVAQDHITLARNAGYNRRAP